MRRSKYAKENLCVRDTKAYKIRELQNRQGFGERKLNSWGNRVRNNVTDGGEQDLNPQVRIAIIGLQKKSSNKKEGNERDK